MDYIRGLTAGYHSYINLLYESRSVSIMYEVALIDTAESTEDHERVLIRLYEYCIRDFFSWIHNRRPHGLTYRVGKVLRFKDL